MNIIELLKEIKEKEDVNIVEFAEMDENEKFIEFEYLTVEKNNMYFYIQNSFKGFEVTAYKKINPYYLQQLNYSRDFKSYIELIKIINDDIKELSNKKPLKGTNKQSIFDQLNEYKTINNKKITLYEYLKTIAGARELEILKNLDKIEMKMNTKKYLILEFYNKDGQSFAINTKNTNRLIIS